MWVRQAGLYITLAASMACCVADALLRPPPFACRRDLVEHVGRVIEVLVAVPGVK